MCSIQAGNVAGGLQASLVRALQGNALPPVYTWKILTLHTYGGTTQDAINYLVANQTALFAATSYGSGSTGLWNYAGSGTVSDWSVNGTDNTFYGLITDYPLSGWLATSVPLTATNAETYVCLCQVITPTYEVLLYDINAIPGGGGSGGSAWGVVGPFQSVTTPTTIVSGTATVIIPCPAYDHSVIVGLYGTCNGLANCIAPS